MKKVLLLAVMAIISVTGLFAQSFVATPDGLRDSLNLDKEYLVIPFESKSASVLYNLTNKFCQKSYVSPKNALKSDIKDEYIKISTFNDRFILLQKGLVGESYYGKVNYSANFSFKDGKVKFEITEVKMTIWDSSYELYYRSPGGLTWHIFKSNGKPKGNLPEQYQNYFNRYVSDYIAFINNSEKEKDNW